MSERPEDDHGSTAGSPEGSPPGDSDGADQDATDGPADDPADGPADDRDGPGGASAEASGSVATAERATPTPAPPGGQSRRPLTRHTAFSIGFFGAAGALVAFWLGERLLTISSTLLLIVVALFLAVGLNSGVERLTRRGMPRTWAVLSVIVAVLLALALFVLAIAPVIAEQVAAITKQAPTWLDQLQRNSTVQQLDEQFDLVQRVRDYIQKGDFASTVFGGVVGVGAAVLSALVNTFIIVVLTLYFLTSMPRIRRTAYRFAPASKRDRVADLGDRILRSVGGYVSGAFVVALCAGVSTLIFLFAVGLGEYAVALAVVVALLDVIPMIGATLGAVVVTAIALATDVRTGIICAIFFIVYQQIENYIIYPRVMSRSVDLSGAVIVIAALSGAALIGVIGALLAIPTAAAIQLLVRELVLKRQDDR